MTNEVEVDTDETTPDHEKKVTIHITHVPEVENRKFREVVTETLQQCWDQCYVELDIARDPKDIFQTDGAHPKSLMSYLGITLEAAHDQKIIKNYHFAIVKETGGA